MVTITALLSDEEAQALAQFLKRVGFSEWRQNAVDDEEAYLMRDGCDKIANALVEAGYNPR
ncbi:MAG: hypothetical protein Q7K26_06155 [bacterium]|nr:hypothetical protein [bacterium]